MFAKGLIVLLLLSVLLVGGQAKKVGGLSEETPVDAKVIKYVPHNTITYKKPSKHIFIIIQHRSNN